MKWRLVYLHLIIVAFFFVVNFEEVTGAPEKEIINPQGSLTECHLQVECTAPQFPQAPQSRNESVGRVRKIRIPVRAARGPQGPRGLRGPAGPRGPPGYSPVIDDDVITNDHVRKRETHQNRQDFITERSPIVWKLEEQTEYEDIHVLELQVGNYGFSDRLATLEDFAGDCSIEIAKPNTSRAQYCVTLESIVPELISSSVGIVIDWDLIEGTTAEEIWEAFQQRLVNETIFRPMPAPYSAQFRSPEYLNSWHSNLQDNTRRMNLFGYRGEHDGNSVDFLLEPQMLLILACGLILEIFF
ncbi:unnamed protein product [Mesocestoides corti]|uniref:Nematogalectin n=1 Tax=Mesocestoides corti TaxID=53468 RepID=A0A0R3UES9_MESCO|nr:unnamed protein product [Mesocestoides corti]